MKLKNLLLVGVFLCLTNIYSQIKTEKITAKNQERFITTTISYPISGIYLYEGKKEPIVQLNANGTGIYQYEDLTKKNITWGFECSEIGIPIFKEGFDSASYSLWYKTNDKEDTEWIYAQFSIHFKKKKMYISGERVKEYVEDVKK
ncbi:hypothetical protein [Flavobacterium hydatis]|uniref:Uncharacterized protein n=1 Tax=Flavobacterium hydatis TaxID=991 RepID=A0A085ZWV6_FLAHY|nr:hypothetical protein [Flavobacterium hydatis]KFF08920.1 hypothetical protein IW20_23240 [Flavobacterium hydatis]OXA94487.1 hypothetical protein B0A62_09800 [Flavobacterium hydatis]